MREENTCHKKLQGFQLYVTFVSGSVHMQTVTACAFPKQLLKGSQHKTQNQVTMALEKERFICVIIIITIH